jgi:predicted RNase H-like nuclease
MESHPEFCYSKLTDKGIDLGDKKTDDVVDALCLAVMGKEIARKGIKTVPENPIEDSRGILMQMVYAE